MKLCRIEYGRYWLWYLFSWRFCLCWMVTMPQNVITIGHVPGPDWGLWLTYIYHPPMVTPAWCRGDSDGVTMLNTYLMMSSNPWSTRHFNALKPMCKVNNFLWPLTEDHTPSRDWTKISTTWIWTLICWFLKSMSNPYPMIFKNKILFLS